MVWRHAEKTAAPAALPASAGPSRGSVCSNEWQCTELSSRWLYQEYGIPQYLGDGSQLVWGYNGNRLIKVDNGARGQNNGPTRGVLPGPGELSVSLVQTFGWAYSCH